MKDITRSSSVLYGTGSRRYTAGARAFHWITALLVFTIIPLGWVFAEFKTNKSKTAFEAPFPGSPADYASIHETIGLVIFVIVAVRILYRVLNPPPALPGRMAGWERAISHASHWLLYAVLVVMPVSGYIMSSGGKDPISILGLFDFPKLPIDKDAGKIAEKVHVYTQWAVYALIGLHVLATAWHLLVRRDAILDRMLPRQANAE